MNYIVRARTRGTDATHVSKGSGYTVSEMNLRERERLDKVVITVRCASCPEWSFTGPSVEARAAASLHRDELHPDTGPKRRTVKRECAVPGCIKWCRPGSQRCWDHATLKEAALERVGPDGAASSSVEPDGRDLLERMDAGVPLNDEPVLGEAARVGEWAVTGSAALRVGDPVRSDASPNTEPTRRRKDAVTECKIEGCTSDASSAPKAGPTARLCATHRAERSAEISKARTGRPRGARGVAGGGGNASGQKRPQARKTTLARRPKPTPVAHAVEYDRSTGLASLLLARLGSKELDAIAAELRASIGQLESELALITAALTAERSAHLK